MKKDHELFENIKENSSNISDIWFSTRKNATGSIYSKDANSSVEQELRKQHIYTIETIASGFLEDQSVFEKNIRDWIKIVVSSRLKWDTPIYEVLEALSKTKRIIWDYVTEYSAEHDEIDKQDVLRWTATYHTTIDTLINKFAEQYYKATREKLQAQQELIDEIHSPVIPVVDGVAVLPLVGFIDEVRANSLLETIPVKCSKANVTALVIDVSGVTYVDSLVSERMLQLIYVLELLGIDCTISGIRPEVAQTSIQIGLDFSRLKTFLDLKQALMFYGVGKNN
ncbi:STAS domain-containing protein [Peribacillus kribbensis]|uniref:STAS domain-containing protein n=1 Tax=Peribacillus kribbensis TaxID=356658 RepID=UPI0004114753|nr:STAS domain-containing protein [Peribacillus kribbensis]